jgi:hypothetical protein
VPEPEQINELLTIPGVAREVGCSESTVRRHLLYRSIKADFFAIPSGIPLFRRESVPLIKSTILNEPPFAPDGTIAIYGRPPNPFK